ncbi:MAG: 50S ribosomal protein L4 [Candidatus Amoebophilus sp. 36-38]|nr:MAG: 50S ribosomal protein L4 [Candidatus Amoebophilus sp. 36-38]
MELSVLQHTGNDTGRKVVLSDEIFGIEPNDHAIYLDIKHILANRRQGTHKSKERGEIAGSTRKIKKQKGTGTARAGSIKSPLFRGGGRVFGPRPKDYGFKLNKKLKKLARKSALTYKAQQGKIAILEDFSFEFPKTKMYAEMLQNLNLSMQKTLLILAAPDKNIILASRNLPDTAVTLVEQVNTYDLLHAKKIIMSEAALSKLTENLSNA